MCTSSWSSFTPSIDDSLCWHPELETNNSWDDTDPSFTARFFRGRRIYRNA
jgi:hypothetical protein